MNSTLALISGLGLETSGLGLEALGLETPGLVNIAAHITSQVGLTSHLTHNTIRDLSFQAIDCKDYEPNSNTTKRKYLYMN